jgi:hypothetical protein
MKKSISAKAQRNNINKNIFVKETVGARRRSALWKTVCLFVDNTIWSRNFINKSYAILGKKRKNLCANVREAQEENVLLFCIIFDAKSLSRFLVVVRSLVRLRRANIYIH